LLLWGASAFTLLSALHRFTSGATANWSADSIQWTPPGGIWLICSLYVFGGAMLVLAWTGLAKAKESDARIASATLLPRPAVAVMRNGEQAESK
jgi:energy-converting hydrogenase Eha subunit H